MKLIKLGTKDVYAKVDDEDYEYLSRLKWTSSHKGRNFYAIRRQYIDERKENGLKKATKISMHRVVMKVSDKNILIDHIDGDGLNNQKSNLRIVDYKENRRNSKKAENASSKYKGVSWLKCRNRWKATIYINGKNKQIGLYKDEIKAAMAYDEFAKTHFGEHAWLNFK